MPNNQTAGSPRISAQQVYATMQPYALTREQQDAVEGASVQSPSLVVAGAGSGKTELMAVRVVWLVANGYARPEQILGLTFTRKAASELSKRIFGALLTLRDSEYWPAGLEYDFTQPTVTTYNSYANSLFRENALGLGMEAESSLLTEAAGYQLAREVVVRYGAEIDPRLADIELSLDSIIEAVLELAGAMNDNLADAQQVANITAGVLNTVGNLPKKAGGSDFTQFGYYSDLLAPFANTEVIAHLAQAYRSEKAKQGYVDYSDQVALAERAVRELPEVGQAQRARFTQVLLDEYQDTSVLQTRLLAQLFAGTSVFAVGDPNQSIYGWRGASASNLANYFTDFGAPASEGEARFELSTSWRNPIRVLELANHLARDLGSPASYLGASQNHLVPLRLRSRSDAPEGRVQIKVDQTLPEEAESVATWLKANYQNHRSDWEAQNRGDSEAKYKKPKAAVLSRSKKNMQLFREAIEDAGLRVEVVGIGGLLELSEIVDLVSALKVIHDPSSGSELVRLLTGARWRIGAKDIDRLFRFAKRQNRFQRKTDAVAPEDSVSLVDALDLLLVPENRDEAKLSEAGLARMLNAAELFANLRKQTGLPLPDFVRRVEQELWLDIEVMANPKRQQPMAHLNAFSAIVSQYAQTNHQPHLGAFLRWLEFAEDRERFEAPTSTPEPGVVQLLTVHASKGLEWDFVAIANLTKGDFPSEGKGASGWLANGKLPYPLRGDKNSLPSWNYRAVESQPELRKSIEAFKDDVKAHLYREELRLMYVAVTRPKQALLLSASYWKPAVKGAKKLSGFLEMSAQLAAERVEVYDRRDEGIFPPCESDVNPLELVGRTEVWPLEPLGKAHSERVKAVAVELRKAISEEQRNLSTDLIGRLLAERAEILKFTDEVPLPVRINASAFKDYLTKPEETAARMLRPVPTAPFKATRAGTLFHALMEERFAGFGRVLGEDPEQDETELSELLWAQQLERNDLADYAESIENLKSNFALSRWANLPALEAELEIQLAVDDNIFICKLDAVFETADGRHEIIDWKTGAAPVTEADIAERTLQLELYRVAYATLRNLPLTRVGASLYYVAENREIKADSGFDLAELRQRWRAVLV